MKLTIDFPSTALPTDVLAAEELLQAVLKRAPTIIGFSGMIGARLPTNAADRLKAILPTCRVTADVK